MLSLKGFACFGVRDEHACIQDTTSFEHDFVKIFPTVFPLLSELSLSADSTWWLLDSGAGVTVLSDAHFPLFGTQIEKFSDEGSFFCVQTKTVFTVPVAFSEARFQVKKSACFWRHGRYQE